MSYLLLISAALLAYFLCAHYRAYNSLKQFKGPWPTGWSRLWLLRATVSGEMHLWFKSTNDRYGSTARIGPSYLLTTDLALLRAMSAVRSNYGRSDFYKALRIHPTRDNITSVRDEKLHRELRNQMAAGYSGKENRHLEKSVDDCIKRLTSLIQSTYTSTPANYRPLDLARITTFFTLDTISEIAFGKTFGFLERNDDPFGYIQQLKSMLPTMMIMAVYPELQTIMRIPMVQRFLPKATDAMGIGKVMGFARDVVAERFPAMGKPPLVERQDMLGSFKDHGLTQDELESETLTQITAGSDSSATAIRMTLFHIMVNPECENRLVQELAAAGYPSLPLASSEEVHNMDIIPDATARKLPYLQACIKEGLRLYAPVIGLLSKQSPPDGDTITVRYPDGTAADVFVPPNTRIGANWYGIGHDAATFGPDVELWRPERWLEAAEEKLADMDQAVGMMFGYGRFGCLGKPVAMIELNKVVPELLRRFRWRVARPERPWRGFCAGFWLHEHMDFVVTERV